MTATAPRLRRLVLVELRKTTDTRAGRWLLGLIGVVSVGAVILLVFADRSGEHDFSDFLYTAQLPMLLLLPVLGILTMTSEWSQRTALATFALVPRRARVLTAKLLGLLALAFLLVVASVTAAVVATVIGHAGVGAGAFWGPLLGPIARVALFESLIVFVGAAFGLALLNAPAALVGFFLLPSVFTGLVSLIPSLRHPVKWLDLVTNTTHLLGDDLTSAVWSRLAVSILVWGVALFAVGAFRVQRRDVN